MTELDLVKWALEDPLARFAYADWLEENGRLEEATKQRAVSEFVRKVEFSPAYDKRHPDPSKNYGIGGVNLRMVLVGAAGAVQFVLFTQWHLNHVAEEMRRGIVERGSVDDATLRALFQPQPADVGYHSRKPRYEGQDVMSDDCEYLGCPCYYDGSGIAAWEVHQILLREGDKGVWKYLEDYYNEIFG